MSKWIAISIIVILVAGVAAAGYFYLQETNKLKDAQSKIVALEGNVSTLDVRLAVAEAEVSILEGGLATAETQVSTLEAYLAAAEAEVSTLEADLDDAEARVSALEAELGIVSFSDTNLEAAIRGAINKPQGPIYKSDLESLTTLVVLGGYLGPRRSGILPKPADAFPLSKQHQRHFATG